MTDRKITLADYPLAERRPELVAGKRGRTVDEISLSAVLDGSVTLDDLAITGQTLVQQSEIARAAGRPTLAQNFERAAELVDVPQEIIMRVYELLRPGRARTPDELRQAAEELRARFGARAVATFIEEAAEVYERRGLFKQARLGKHKPGSTSQT